MRLWHALRLTALAAVTLLCAASCSHRGAKNVAPSLAELRKAAAESDDPELQGRWLLAELIAPGGDARRALEARKKLGETREGGVLAPLARGVDDWVHGRLRTAPEHFMQATRAARISGDPHASLLAWFAARQAYVLRHDAPGLWQRWRSFVEEALNAPLNLGWRARGELAEWWASEAYSEATRDVDELSAERFGCVKALRIAGPFGRGAATDAIRSFSAEAPGPWPARWQPDPGVTELPRILKTDRKGCFVSVDERADNGIFYAETFLTLDHPAELIVAVQSALAVWIDDRLVLDRDPRKWGVWPKFGAGVRFGAGRHRVLARLGDAATSIRVLYPNGRPFPASTSIDPAPGYSLIPPELTEDPNVLMAYLRDGRAIDPGDDLLRFIAAYLANVEGQSDVANVLLEPLLAKPEQATGPTLDLTALFTENDPIFDTTQVRDLVRELHERAVAKDKALWQPRLSLALWQMERSGKAEAAREVKALVDAFPEVPAVLQALSRLYGELGWSAEYANTAKLLAQRFPENVEALSAAVEVLDARGENARADELVQRIKKLDPDGEVPFGRALAREDYAAALAELRRLARRRPEREDITERIYDVMVRAGNERETWKKLAAAIEKTPKDPRARLALADASYADNRYQALAKALVDAVVAGAPTQDLRDALDLVEGISELEGYRIDAKSVIAGYEKAGKHMPGTAARVLDYAAVWVRSDGSSRMLEHEIIRIQSPEAVSKLAEHRQLEGIVLHMRVIKQDGRILEPEVVAGKPTVTFPHLEVGDYIETEHITTQPGDGPNGSSYSGPHWFFREANVAYARSEFVAIAPKSKPLEIETRGAVPEPKLSEDGGMVVRRWRVDFSPAAPVEPNSAPIVEFLPSVRIGWGIDLEERLRRLMDTVGDLTPVDPRIYRIAKRIVDPLPPAARAERARRLYRWVLDNVEDGQETDGRRVVVGKRGNRWRGFMTLCRALGIQVDYAIAQNRLAMPPLGPLSRSMLFTEPLLVLEGEKGAIWLTVSSKYAPFAYVPDEVRGMPAFLLAGPAPKPITVPSGGTPDAVGYEGDVTLAADGSAKLELVQKFYGKYAMALRTALAELPEGQLHDVIESRLLGRDLRGAKLISFKLEQLDDLDAPLALRMSAEMANFAQQTAGDLVIGPPFTLRISQLTALPARQTPLLIGDATRREVTLRIKLPPGYRVRDRVGGAKVQDGDRRVTVSDAAKDGVLTLSRLVDLPAGRVRPADYPRFVEFARRADDVQSASVRLGR